jgi:hypothetical protein
MNNFESQRCLNMARSLDAEATRMRDHSYVRKMIEERAAKYRTDAATSYDRGANNTQEDE